MFHAFSIVCRLVALEFLGIFKIIFSERPFFHGRYYPYSHNRALKFVPGQMLLPRQNKQLLDYEYGLMGNHGPGVDCCPSVLEMVEPEGGKNDQDIYVELYKSDNYRQR